ncbi:MAG: nucleotidyltransferase domain-containing protein [Planctomycetes bacterium]|nr:nucleotidyltransferase domain-containing protein [Planctomycetota bacterium]
MEPDVAERNSVWAEIARRLVEAYRPERIYLFGSSARGEDGPVSDYDILMVVATNFPQFPYAISRHDRSRTEPERGHGESQEGEDRLV